MLYGGEKIMKKSLFMLALGLTIATSMVAGTMAVYTHTDTILANGSEGGITGIAKQFYIGAKTTQELDDFKLAPGESKDWGFNVTNKDDKGIVSEVETDVIVNVNVGTAQDWADLQVVLKRGDTVVGTMRPNNGVASFTDASVIKASTPFDTNYTITFEWLDGTGETLNDAQDTALVMDENGVKANLPKVQGITVTVTGTQSK